MSNYLGFNPTDNPVYYFVSYNSEDAHRTGEIAKVMSHSGINLWYDYGIEYGDNWENVISERLNNAQALILFFTKGILQKNNSYVQKEYKMATRFFKKKVYVILLDNIDDSEVPVDKVAWWIDINDNQCIKGYEFPDPHLLTENVAAALGIQSHRDKMNKVIERYNELYHSGRLTEAEDCLSEYLHGMSLEGKVMLLDSILSRKFQNAILSSPAETINGMLPQPLGGKSHYFECEQMILNGDVFTAVNDFVFHRGALGDAHVVKLFKNGEILHGMGGLVEAYNLNMFWDEKDKVLYVTFVSEKESFENGKFVDSVNMRSIFTVEDPNGLAICTNFKYIE